MYIVIYFLQLNNSLFVKRAVEKVIVSVSVSVSQCLCCQMSHNVIPFALSILPPGDFNLTTGHWFNGQVSRVKIFFPFYF